MESDIITGQNFSYKESELNHRSTLLDLGNHIDGILH